MTDKRAHERLDNLETVMNKHLEDHAALEAKIGKAVELTQQVANNTKELVEIFTGAQGLRKLVVFIWPFALVLAALLMSAIVYVRGGWK